MHAADFIVIGVYMLAMLGIGAWFYRRQTSTDEYFVGDRKMGAGHIGLSVVATDVGGGFSIGLGGVGFTMGISGSWLLFTGLLGAWLAAVILIPRVKPLADERGWLTFPEFLGYRFDGRTRLAAALVSAVGYMGFVGAQVLAGAKLSSAAFEIDLQTAVWVMAAVVVAYTAFGGLQAVIYTDTVQWIVLLGGLALVGLPFGWHEVGGWEGMRAALPPDHFSLTNISALELATWLLTIVPIWFVGMTLYQRIYATRDVRTARRAWLFAGLLEYPVMAFIGVVLGMMGRVAFPEAEPEMGLPLMLRSVLPVGVAGIVLAAYFSAIMSTADSCLLASVGNVVSDLYQRYLDPRASERRVLGLSRVATIVIGLSSVALALLVPSVLDAILLAYAFMVSGLFVPTLAGLLWPRAGASAALASTLVGGGLALVLNIFPALNPLVDPADAASRLDPILLALPASALTLVVWTLLSPRRAPSPEEATGRSEP